VSNPLDPKRQLKINRNPIQRPGQDVLLRETVFGGPDACRDVRLYLDAATLEHLLDIARQAASQTCFIGQAGICIQVYQNGDGHTYEVWKIVGTEPRPVRVMGI
jgi:hypothetical protein